MLGYTREIVFWILLTFFNFVLCNFHNSSYKPTRPSQKCVAWSYGDSLLIVQVHILSACAASNRKSGMLGNMALFVANLSAGKVWKYHPRSRVLKLCTPSNRVDLVSHCSKLRWGHGGQGALMDTTDMICQASTFHQNQISAHSPKNQSPRDPSKTHERSSCLSE
jgi:hypothetical protein